MNTPASYIGTAFIAVLLSVNILMQVHLVLGDVAVGPTAFISPQHQRHTISKSCVSLRSLPWKRNSAESSSCSFSQSDAQFFVIESQDRHRRSLLTSVAALTLFGGKADANNNTSTTDIVDWNIVAPSLRQASPEQKSTPVVGVSDLEKALEDSANRRKIDPRTHG